VLADGGVEAVWQAFCPVEQPGTAQGLAQVGVAGFGPGQPQVLGQRGVEDVRVLLAQPDDRAQGVAVNGGDVHATQRHGPRGRIEEPEQHHGQRGLS
jgi:hypothetical protein